MTPDRLRVISDQLLQAGLPAMDVHAWIRACTPGRTVVSQTGAMAHLRDRSINAYTYYNCRARLWAIADGCAPHAPHAVTWDKYRLHRYMTQLITLAGEPASPATKQLSIVALERMMRATAPQVDRRFFLDAVNELPRETDNKEKLRRLQDSEALWDCGMGYYAEPEAFDRRRSRLDVTRRTGAHIASLAEWALRLERFTRVELWLDLDPPEHYPWPCLIARSGRWYLLNPDANGNRKADPASSIVSERLMLLLKDYVGGVRERLRGTYTGRQLWVSTKIGPLGANATYKHLVAKTEAAFGLAVNPHLFRDALSTTEALRCPTVDAAAHLKLGNTRAINAAVYEHAGSRAASRVMSSLTDDLCRRAGIQLRSDFCAANLRDTED